MYLCMHGMTVEEYRHLKTLAASVENGVPEEAGRKETSLYHLGKFCHM